MNVLVVDDSSVMRHLIVKALSQSGLNPDLVLQADDGHAALDQIRNRGADIDLILCDVNMPQMNGIDFVREVRLLPDMQRTPITMVSTETTWQVMRDALQAGADAYLTKPFTPEGLREKLALVMGG